jgi:hypothetical protein
MLPLTLTTPLDASATVPRVLAAAQVSLGSKASSKPSSVAPSQSSSWPLQISGGAMQLPQVHEAVQVLVPVEPQLVVQLPVAPWQQAQPSSHVPSQSSSWPLQLSAGGTQLPQAQVLLHVRVPVEPQLVVQLDVEPRQQLHPSSHVPSQSSSTPLHVSAGGVQLPQAQDVLHVRVPVEPQLVVQLPLVPRQQAHVSSHRPSQSSSMPLQVSDGGTQLPQAQELLHVRVPVVPQLVVQLPLVPRQQAHVSSQPPSQSSSMPLHVSVGGVQLPHVQELEHMREPVVPQLVVQLPLEPRQHGYPSSHVPSQSSSTPLHVSEGGTQVPQLHEELQVCSPVVPQLVVQVLVWPARQGKVSSISPLQSLSTPSQTSGVPLPGVQLSTPPMQVELVWQGPVPHW